MKFWKLDVPCPECDEDKLRLVLDDDLYDKPRMICTGCEEVNQEVDADALCVFVAAVLQRAKEGDGKVTTEWLTRLVDEKLL